MSNPTTSGRPAVVPAKKPAEATHASQDWQTAYVWAFIVKFHGNLVGKAGLSTVMDLEIALMASGEDDVLAYIFQKMVSALKDGSIRDMRKENMPRHLFRVVEEYIKLPPWSTYHDAPRSRDSKDYRSVFNMTQAEAEHYHSSLNPLRAAMLDAALDDGGGPTKGGQKAYEDEAGRMLWRLDWKEKLRLLRQLVDWQLVHSVTIRQTVAECYNVVHQKTMDFNKATNRLIVEPIAQDRTKRRFWSLDDSPRIYTSTNPFKKNCPFTPIASSKDDLLALTASLREANEYYPPPPPADGSAAAPVDMTAPSPPAKKKVKAEKKDKNSKQNDGEVKIIRFIEEEHLPRVEKEIVRQEAARKKANKVALMQAQAESYSMRTTRTRRQVDYKALDNGTAFGGDADSDDDRANGDSDDGAYSNAGSEGSGRRRSGRQMPARAEGSRRSTRVQLRDEEEEIEEAMRQSRREAEMERAMRGGGSASASGDNDDDDDDDDDVDGSGGGDDDDEEVPGGSRPKGPLVLESDDDDESSAAAPTPMDVDPPVDVKPAVAPMAVDPPVDVKPNVADTGAPPPPAAPAVLGANGQAAVKVETVKTEA